MNEKVSGHLESEHGKNPLPKIYLLIGFVAAVTVGSMGYIFYVGSQMVAGNAPLIDAAMEIKLEATTAHLWFEEIISGDCDESIEDVLKHINQADWYAQAMLDGGQSAEGEILPLKEARLRQDITEVRNKLVELRAITLQRWQSRGTAGVGSEMDQRYDAGFKDFVVQADLVEAELQRLIRKQLTVFRAVQTILIAICLCVTVAVGAAFSRFVHRRIHDELALRAANQQLAAEEQQLRAANQQLQAHEQQLRASNQQLLASEQQLRAANQQLTSSEQALRQSEAQYRGLVDSIDGIVWECDARTFGFSFVSKRAEELLGYPVKRWFTGPTFWKDHIHKDDREWATEFCMQATSEMRDHEFEYRMVGADNQIVWFRDIVRVITENNEPVTLRGVMIDITERKRAEEKERIAAERLSLSIENMLEGYALHEAILDESGRMSDFRYLQFNPTAQDIVRVSREEIIGKTALELFPSIAERGLLDTYADVMATGEPQYIEDFYYQGDHLDRAFDISCFRVDQRHFVCIFRDVTERKRAEGEAREKQRQMDNLLSNVDAIILEGDSFDIYYVGGRIEKILGYPKESWFAEPGGPVAFWSKLLHPDDKGKIDTCRQAIVAGENHSFEYRMIASDGREVWFYDSVTVEPSADGPAKIRSIMIDITERKNREKELAEYKDQLRALVSELTVAEDRERRNIASLLHDDILQKLAFSKMKLGMLRETLTSGEQLETLDNIHEQVSAMFKDMRSLTFDLCPPVLYDIGLEAALRDWLQREMADKQGIGISLETQGEPVQLNEELRVALYRATREVLINVIKHAQAQNVDVRLVNLNETVRVEVRDDGIGFERSRADENNESCTGLGLFTVRERLEYFGGSLEIESEPGKGSRVILTAALTSREGYAKGKVQR